MTDSTLLVQTAHGAVRGELIDNVRVFRGIPFAAPPVGALRWRPPVAPTPWREPLDATRFGDDCPQRPALPVGSRAAAQSEDCLTLNIWSPAKGPNERLPVMVWIFGGSFVFGSASEERADGMTFAREGVVYVTVNYRVGMFGFLAHPNLSAESPNGASGNYGLLDQIAALRWVRENIERFGGDPGRVTVFGVSAGAASISLLLTAPLATGLFQQVILQSPGAFRPLASLADAESAGLRLGEDVEALRRMSPAELMDRQKLLEPPMRSLTAARVLRPIRDGWVIQRDDADSFLSGDFIRAPAIIGSMDDEGSNAVASWPINTLADFSQLLERNFGTQAESAAEVYRADSDGDVRRVLGDLFGDTQFAYGVEALSRIFSAGAIPIYRYVFTRRRPGKPAPKHSEEVSYIFARPELPPRGDNDHRIDENDKRLAANIHAAWVAFAKTGSPGNAAGIQWPLYRAAESTLMEFGDGPRLRQGWRAPQMAFLDRFFGHFSSGE
jgi:para-nitrobenzyl esterase